MKFGNEIYVVALDGIPDTRSIEAIPERIRRNAVRAVNYAAGRSRTRTAKEMRDQVNFPASYLRGDDSRLALRTAKGFGDEASITGRFRPTSLARFATRGRPSKPGVTFEVTPGKATRSKRMFLIRLPAGRSGVDTKSNMGVAIRLKPGETIDNKKVTLQQMGKTGLYLLFGPSVNQVFRSVAGSDIPNIETDLQREFSRLMGTEGL
ncbi:hypothetical protein [Novosphingobium resinovorum]|uniref:Uncharacterized protein n=1 Tax=Novosphingobium resinovorum TaxID=158500 RepID=A0A1D8A346_9SPHN|nr:hypothetical protein [Novosphingobium resinovorum]AOR76573.1 hypothetical protein BES08_07285 [Novosphingobium resinovorum]